MTLLIDKKCIHCRNVEEIAERFPSIRKLYVNNGNILYDNGFEQPLDKRIPSLPALVAENVVYVGEKFILDFINKLSEEK